MLSWSLLCASNFFDGINFEPSARKWWSMNNIFDTIFSNNPLEKGSDFFFHSKQESFPPNFFVFNQSCLLITQGKKLGKEKHSLKKKSRWNLGQTQFFFSAFNFSLLFLLYFFFVVLVETKKANKRSTLLFQIPNNQAATLSRKIKLPLSSFYIFFRQILLLRFLTYAGIIHFAFFAQKHTAQFAYA